MLGLRVEEIIVHGRQRFALTLAALPAIAPPTPKRILIIIVVVVVIVIIVVDNVIVSCLVLLALAADTSLGG